MRLSEPRIWMRRQGAPSRQTMRKDGKDSEAHVGLAAKQVTLATMVLGRRSTSRQRPFPSLRIVWENYWLRAGTRRLARHQKLTRHSSYGQTVSPPQMLVPIWTPP